VLICLVGGKVANEGSIHIPRVGLSKEGNRKLLMHWLSWVLPLLAVLLPILGFVVAASIPVDAMRWGEARTALGRGDFLIPVLLVCIDAVWRWCVDVKCGLRMGIVGVFSCGLCVAAGIVCLYSFSVASSLPITKASTDSVTLITLTALVAGGAAGMIAVAASPPKDVTEGADRTKASPMPISEGGAVPVPVSTKTDPVSPSRDGE
jgi:hypothetical protein